MDSISNFAQTTVAVAPSPALSGTTFTVATGTGALFPSPATAPYNIVRWPVNSSPTSANAEIVRITALTGDAFTMTRAQEGTTAKTWTVNDNVALVVTAKTITDLQTAILDVALEPSYTTPTALFESFNYQEVGQNALATRAIGGTTGTVYMNPVWLPAGLKITNLKWLVGSTGATTPTHSWLGLANLAGLQLAHTADQTSAAIAANSLVSLALTAPYTVLTSGVYFVLQSVTATANPTAVGLAAVLQPPPGISAAGMVASGVSTSAAQPAPGTDGVTSYGVPTTAGAVIYYYGT